MFAWFVMTDSENFHWGLAFTRFQALCGLAEWFEEHAVLNRLELLPFFGTDIEEAICEHISAQVGASVLIREHQPQ